MVIGRRKVHKMIRIIIFISCMFICNASFANPYTRYNSFTKYDVYFSKYTKRYFGPAFDWRHFKAQAIAESNLDNDAVSPVGAKGLMQIMPVTYEEIRNKHTYIKGSSDIPRWNIASGIYYDRRMWNIWTSERPFQDRLDFMYASYNAGAGNVIKAQKLVKKPDDPNLWLSVKSKLHKVTGKHSNETLTYVERIKLIKRGLRR